VRTRALLTALLLAAQAGPAAAFGASARGTSGAQFLEIAPGARPAAMGGAFAGVADDVHAVYYNPAGLATIERIQITGMDDQYFQGINYDFAALAVPLLFQGDSRVQSSYGVLGFSVSNLSVGNIPSQGTTETAAPTGTFSSDDYDYSLSYAYAFRDTGLSLGLTGKYVVSTLDGFNASVFAADAGALYKQDRLSIGAGLRNLGSSYGFAGVSDPLPFMIYAGAGYKLTEHWLASVELDAPRDNPIVFAVGTEYVHPFTKTVSGAVRAGFNSADSDAGGFGGVSFGGGIAYGSVGFDFALLPFGDLGNTYRYSLLVKF
jgi:long-subunit fatty acid transport protein